MKKQSQNGFTLIELLVVIGIIGILSAALMVSVPGMLETSRSLKCKANLKNLAQAVSNYGISFAKDSYLPNAGSYEWATTDWLSQDEAVIRYHSSGAWVTWTPNGKWPYPSDKSARDSMTPSTFYDKNRSERNSKAFYSLTNGVLWSLVGKETATYVCETHKKLLEKQTGGRVHRSFVMNHFFGFDDRKDPPAYRRTISADSLKSTASICLLFAELPGQRGKTIDTSKEKGDSVLDPEGNEYPGFNHKIGKKWIANVAFADGHVEGLVQPIGANPTDLKELTEQLCNGTEIEAEIRAKMQ
jgi:prepilin-type N-terminal cleavage/methylation domain-containing protein/prepilin-type processing-associated H-X9-DG protein